MTLFPPVDSILSSSYNTPINMGSCDILSFISIGCQGKEGSDSMHQPYEEMVSHETKTTNLQLTLIKQVTDAIIDNDDLLIEILACLPVNSLLRFKSVSKRCLSLVSSPEFGRRLYPDHHSVSGIFLPDDSDSDSPDRYDFIFLRDEPTIAPFKSLTFVDDPCGITVLQSCHGLFLCCTSMSRTTPPEVCNYYVHNPTTKQFATLPRPGCGPATNQFVPFPALNGTGPVHVCSLTLAFDPDKSPYYKVVCVQSSTPIPDIDVGDTSAFYQIEIYSSETRSWRHCDGPLVVRSGARFENGVFCSGAIHWVGNSGSCFYFNVEEEQLREMPMPPVPADREERSIMYFGESRGHLHLVEIYHSPSTHFDVYEMGRDYSGWVLYCRVDLDAVATAFPRMVRSYADPSDLQRYVFDILSVQRGAKDGESHLLLHLPGAIVGYNLKEKSFKKMSDFESVSIKKEGFIVKGSIRRLHWSRLYKLVQSFTAL